MQFLCKIAPLTVTSQKSYAYDYDYNYIYSGYQRVVPFWNTTYR